MRSTTDLAMDPTATIDRPLRRRAGPRARLLVVLAVGLMALLGVACEPQPLPSGLVQRITNVSAQPFGTQIAVHFDTSVATDDARVEIWKGTELARLALEQAPAPTKTHNITASYLDPATTYTVKVFAPKAIGPGEVSYTVPSAVTTLTRMVTVTARWAQVHNDGDANECGEGSTGMRVTGRQYFANFGSYPNPSVICDGSAWDPADQSKAFDGANADQLQLEGWAQDDDGIICIDCHDSASGSTWIDLDLAHGGFTEDAAMEFYPEAGSALRLTWYLRYTVSYHA